MNTNDQALLDRLKAGDDTAFSELVSLYRRWMLYVAYKILENETEAEDVVQEFFIDCWEKQAFKKVTESLKSFLHRAIRNRCMNRIRNENLRRNKLKILAQQETATLMPADENSDRWERMLEVIEKVPPMSAKVFRYTYFDGMNRKEVALQMGISPSTVKHQLARALRIIRSLISDLL